MKRIVRKFLQAVVHQGYDDQQWTFEDTVVVLGLLAVAASGGILVALLCYLAWTVAPLALAIPVAVVVLGAIIHIVGKRMFR